MVSFFKKNCLLFGLVGVLLYFTWLMVLITLQYIPINFQVAFLRIKQAEIALRYYQYAFFIHVYTSIFVLVTGILQLLPYIRIRLRHVHRALGKVYVFLIIFLAGPSGLVMGYHANGGFSSQLAFCLLAVLWVIFTYQAYSYARKKDWVRHKNWMYRSFALTLSAISLRLFKWMIVSAIAPPPMDVYRFVAWAGWVVNLAVVEIYIYIRLRRQILKSSCPESS